MFYQENDGIPYIKTTESCSSLHSSKIQAAWKLRCPHQWCTDTEILQSWSNP